MTGRLAVFQGILRVYLVGRGGRGGEKGRQEKGIFEGVDKKTGNAYKIEPCRRNLNRPPGGGEEGGLTGKAFWGRIKRFARIREEKRPERAGIVDN